jgi:phosphatidylethanolamine-binding protein (PEBP) family uncharacterized protein
MNGAVRKEAPIAGRGDRRTAGARARLRLCASLLPALAVPALGTAVLAGCGGSSGSTTASVPASPAAAAEVASVAAADSIAVVAGVPIAKKSYEHWLAVERKLGASGNASHQALGFLITSEWVLGEAAGRHIAISEAEVKKRFASLVHQSFPKAGSMKAYLARSGETEADLLARIKVELLASHIAARVTAGKPSSQRAALLTGFEHNFQAHWKALTTCSSGYVMEDCKQYKGAPENLTATKTGSAASRSTSRANTNGEVYTAPGGFNITSPAFERNGQIPAEYTCAGKGVSPPLSWQNVPAKAAALFLFVIDDNSSGKSGGIRWVVGNIDPSSTGVAAGQTPKGGVVGTNTEGKAAYSPVCPAHGKSDTIEFVMYALSKKLALSPGFNPTTAEADYGQHKLLMGQAAVNYGIATR